MQELTKAKDEGKLISFDFDGDQEKAKAILQQIGHIWPDVVWQGGETKPTDLKSLAREIYGTISVNYGFKNKLTHGHSFKKDDITLTAQEFLAMTTHNIPANTQWIGEPFEFEGAWYREVKPQLGWWYEGKGAHGTDRNCWNELRHDICIVSHKNKFNSQNGEWKRCAIPHPAPELSEKDKQIKLINDKIAKLQAEATELQAEAKKLEGMK